MRVGALKQLREACLQQSGNDQKKANKLIAKKFSEGIANKSIVPKDVSYKALFEGLVDMEDVDRDNIMEVAEAVSSSAFPIVTTTITHAITIEPYDQRMNTVMELVTQGDAVMTDTETVRGMTAIGGIRRRLETEAYDETDFGEKKVAVSKSDFGRIIALTMEDIFNDRTGDIQAKANTIGEDAGIHQEQFIIETLECLPRTALGESASRAFVYDGTVTTQGNFYNATHATILDYQVNKNTHTGGITEAGLSAGYLNFSVMKDERARAIIVKPSHIVVHSQYELVLANILATEKVVGVANNDTGMFGPRGRVSLKPIFTPFLATTTSLNYMGAPSRSLLWLWVQRPQTVTQGASSDLAFRRQILWQARFNYYGGVAHRDYRYISRGTA